MASIHLPIYNPISMEGELIICGTSRNGFTTNHNGFWIRTSLSGDLLDGLILDTYPYNFINKLDLYQTPSETYLALFRGGACLQSSAFKKLV